MPGFREIPPFESGGLRPGRDAGVFVLSQNPYADCFFCGYGGPESAIELKLIIVELG